MLAFQEECLNFTWICTVLQVLKLQQNLTVAWEGTEHYLYSERRKMRL